MHRQDDKEYQFINRQERQEKREYKLFKKIHNFSIIILISVEVGVAILQSAPFVSACCSIFSLYSWRPWRSWRLTNFIVLIGLGGKGV